MLEDENEAALSGLRDALRSVRRWRELLSDADRQTLLSDVARIGLAVARDLHSGVRDLDIGEGNIQVVPCPVERLAFLQTVAPRVLAAVTRLEAEPPVALRTAERDVPMERARRISPAALRSLSQKPPAVFGRNRLRETVFLPTHDTPPVRAAKTIVATFARDLATIAVLAQEAQLTAVFMEAERIGVRLQYALRRPFWRDFPTLPYVPPLAPTLRRSGAHVLLHDAYRRYRGGFAWDWSHPLFRLPARETWLLYEYWCLFAVIGCLRGIGFRVADAENLVRITQNGVAFTLATDTGSRIRLRRGPQSVSVTYQRRFDRGENDTEGYHSRGQALIPDIAVEYSGRLLILDAKFKTYAERGVDGVAGTYLTALDDIRQLHSYRDAIRHGNDRAVRSAWALYPGRVSGKNRAVIAFPESSPAKPFGNGEVGAVLLRPGGRGSDTLAALIEDSLRD
ncbi:MAG: DUF2357 domain-containing protein [Fibrella sp.]|nr:DUF2357 domain-containing protein [Armatimonadota bacterium]